MLDWNQIKERWASLTWSGTARFALPPVVLEAQPDFVMGARLAGRANDNGKDGSGPVRRISVRQLASGSLRPSPTTANVADPVELRRALRAVADVMGNGTARFGMLVPDSMVRVGILSFETLPADRREADTLVRWRMKENLPFPAEEARISYQVVSRPGGEGGEAGAMDLVVVAARAAVLGEYEAALEEVNGGAASALMLPASLALLPLLPESDLAQALIHVCCGWVTQVVVTGKLVSLWRTRELAGTDRVALLDGVATEVSRVLAASRDRQQMEIDRLWLCARPSTTEAPYLAADLGRALSRQVNVLETDSSLGSALSAEEQRLFGEYGAPVAGLVCNSQ